MHFYIAVRWLAQYGTVLTATHSCGFLYI